MDLEGISNRNERRHRDDSQGRSSSSGDKVSDSAGLLLSFENGDTIMRRSALRNDAAFWSLGLLNNASYVVMMAVAKEIAPGAVGVVFLANVAPTLVIKTTAPYWFHLVPYSLRVWACSASMLLSYVLVSYGRSTGAQLLGVSFSSLQGGLGEASFLALAALYDTPRALTSWSSGTGFAGIFGYAWVFLFRFIMGFSLRLTVMLASLFAVAWLLTYFCLLEKPHSPRSSSAVLHGDYSPLTSLQAPPSPAHDGNGHEPTGEGAKVGNASSGLRTEIESNDPTFRMTAKERLRLALGLWPYTVPLMLVYFAEYTMQTGTWSAIGFPITSETARQRFYEYANWSYQVGVFISRSSGTILHLSTRTLWALPILQFLFLIFFYAVAVERFWYNNSLLLLCFSVGLLGGLAYVNAFRLVSQAVPPEKKELALASASVGDSFGVVASDIAGTFVQACVYKHNDIPGAWASC